MSNLASPTGPAATGRPGFESQLADPLRDVGAFLLLLAALFLPWDRSGDTGKHFWALMPVLLAIVGISITHLVRVFQLSPGLVQLLKFVSIAPLLLAAAYTIGAETVYAVTSDSEWPDGGGVGVGLALAVTGAFLVAQPRAADDLPGGSWDTAFWAGALLCATTAAFVMVVSWVWFLLDTVGLGTLRDDFNRFVAYLWPLLTWLLVVIVPAGLLADGRAAGRRLLAVVGLTWVALVIPAKLTGTGTIEGQIVSMPMMESWQYPSPALFLVGAAGALAVSRGAGRRTSTGESAPARGGTAGWALLLAAVVLLVQAASILWILVERSTDVPTALPVHGVITLVGAALLAGAWASLGRSSAIVTMGLTAIGVLVGVVAVIHRETAEVFTYMGLDPAALIAWFALPALAFTTLLRGRRRGAERSGAAEIVERPAQ